MKSPIRWAGSKRLLLPHLKALWRNEFKRYVEPFCGSACLFFSIEPKTAILGDLNDELIEMYLALKQDPYLVLECTRRLRRGERSYYAIRSQNPRFLSRPEKAARFLYLNRYCFNGIYRTNASGTFNVPYGPPRSKLGLDEETIVAASARLKSATLISGDFNQTLSEVEKGDFVYLDPPYAISKRRVFAEYHPSSFVVSDLQRLSTALHDMDKSGIFFAVSYGDSPEARTLLKSWSPKRVWTRRHIAGFADARRGAYELLATNFN
jgi:DNA adenine methylase